MSPTSDPNSNLTIYPGTLSAIVGAFVGVDFRVRGFFGTWHGEQIILETSLRHDDVMSNACESDLLALR